MTPPTEGAGRGTPLSFVTVDDARSWFMNQWRALNGAPASAEQLDAWITRYVRIREEIGQPLRATPPTPAAAPSFGEPHAALDLEADGALQRVDRLAAANLYHHGYRGYGDDVLALLTAFEGAPGADAASVLARRMSDMRHETERLRDELMAWEEREASVCPEDVGLVEYVGILTAERDALAARVGAMEQENARILNISRRRGKERDIMARALSDIREDDRLSRQVAVSALADVARLAARASAAVGTEDRDHA